MRGPEPPTGPWGCQLRVQILGGGQVESGHNLAAWFAGTSRLQEKEPAAW